MMNARKNGQMSGKVPRVKDRFFENGGAIRIFASYLLFV